ncbi:GumC family protein [Azospirillum rugosum]|uniref:non-specific protein-tyrosine kinase n=1 Tax=Azospirillum rugosum TaxID=416170 RepID=A0ABS4SLC9_9PROT|nr:polysaccharide biosynthesis tyrosine autokinase [Azospirillum rugosum]MBP2293370.1 capsular exopolysaccharide synthesis family protein [Azospirillum rugosum]
MSEQVLPSPHRGAHARDHHGRDHYLEIDIVHLARVVMRRRWTVLITTAFLTAATVAAVSTMPPRYSAETTLLLESRNSRLSALQPATEKLIQGLQSDAYVIRTEMDLLTTRSLAEKVIRAMALDQSPEFNPKLQTQSPLRKAIADHLQPVREAFLAVRDSLGLAPEPEPELPPGSIDEEVVREVMSRLTVLNEGGAYTLRVRFVSRDPHLAAAVANKFSEFYLADQANTREESTRAAARDIASRLDELRQTMLASETAARTFRKDHGLLEVNGTTLLNQELVNLNGQLVAAAARRAELDAELKEAERALSSRASMMVSRVVDSHLIQTLREQEAKLQSAEGNLLERLGPRHPDIQNLRSQRAALQDKIDQEVGRILGSLRGEVRAAQGREEALRARLDGLTVRQGALGDNEIRAAQLDREAQINRTIYMNLLEQFKQVDQRSTNGQSDARLISAAVAPSKPSGPSKSMIVVAALVTSAALGVLLVIISDWLRGGISDVEKLEEFHNAVGYGLVPELDGKPNPVGEILAARPSYYREALMAIGAELSLAPSGRAPKIIVVTSSLPQEGKTVLATSLAVTAARAGGRTLLLDFDLRRPAVGRLLDSRPHTDLPATLIDNGAPGQGLIHHAESGLDYIPSSSVTGNVQSLLRSDATRGLLAWAATQYDLVILDTPPVLTAPDSLLLAAWADAVLLAVRWERTPRTAIRNAMRLLRVSNAPIAGTVLTRVNMQQHARYRYGDVDHVLSKRNSYYA